MSLRGTIAALTLFLGACANAVPPPEVSQGAASAVIVADAQKSAGTPEFNGAPIGRDALRSRIQD